MAAGEPLSLKHEVQETWLCLGVVAVEDIGAFWNEKWYIVKQTGFRSTDNVRKGISSISNTPALVYYGSKSYFLLDSNLLFRAKMSLFYIENKILESLGIEPLY